MTIYEMSTIVNKFCDTQDSCNTCPMKQHGLACNTACDVEDQYNKLVELGMVEPPVEETANPEPKIEHDPVNHPSHYCREGAIECIDEMLILFGREAVKNFCLCNAWKYRARAMNKNGEQDLQKSDWYIKKYRELSDIG